MTAADARGWIRPIAETGLQTSAVVFGTSPIGSLPAIFGRETRWQDAHDTLNAVFDSPITALDTSNGYSDGESERRIGTAIDARGGLPEGFLLITKVDAKNGDFSAERVHRSLEESRERLGVDRLPLVHLHDPEFFPFEDIAGPGGAVDELVTMRDRGEIGHLGLAGGDVRTMSRYLSLGVFEVLQTHNRYTLVDRSAEELIDDAIGRGMAVFNAAVYGGGILANPTAKLYGYSPVKDEVRAAITGMDALCTREGTTLAAAALQYSLRDPRITGTVVGSGNPGRVRSIVADAQARALPDEFWEELESLVPARRFWIDS